MGHGDLVPRRRRVEIPHRVRDPLPVAPRGIRISRTPVEPRPAPRDAAESHRFTHAHGGRFFSVAAPVVAVLPEARQHFLRGNGVKHRVEACRKPRRTRHRPRLGVVRMLVVQHGDRVVERRPVGGQRIAVTFADRQRGRHHRPEWRERATQCRNKRQHLRMLGGRHQLEVERDALEIVESHHVHELTHRVRPCGRCPDHARYERGIEARGAEIGEHQMHAEVQSPCLVEQILIERHRDLARLPAAEERAFHDDPVEMIAVALQRCAAAGVPLDDEAGHDRVRHRRANMARRRHGWASRRTGT